MGWSVCPSPSAAVGGRAARHWKQANALQIHRRFSAHTNYQAPRSADDKRLGNDRTRDEAQDQNALVSDGFVGDGDAHEASIVLFLPEVLDASGVTALSE